MVGVQLMVATMPGVLQPPGVGVGPRKAIFSSPAIVGGLRYASSEDGPTQCLDPALMVWSAR